MAFNDGSQKHVRVFTHPCIRVLLSIARPSIQQFLIAYTVDLISVMRELFIITLVESPGTLTWVHLQRAFEKYARQSGSYQRIHESIRSNTMQDGQTLTADDIRRKVRELLNIKL